MTEERGRRPSDLPGDLVREREAFLRSFLKKGFELAEELLAENAELRSEIEHLRERSAQLRAALQADGGVRELLDRIESLERERRAFAEESTERAMRLRTVDARFAELERELGDLANLYVAAFQLHQSLSPRHVLRHILDTCGQLVGSRATVVYVVDRARSVAVPVAWDGVGETLPTEVALGDGPIGESCLTGIARIREHPEAVDQEPAAVIPLQVEGKPVGAIAILSWLPQKSAWAAVDHQLFQLLGTHAGHALVGANLYTGSGLDPLDALRGLEANARRRAPSPDAE